LFFRNKGRARVRYRVRFLLKLEYHVCTVYWQSESPLSRILVELSVFYGNVARFGYLSLATITFKAFPIREENKLVPERVPN